MSNLRIDGERLWATLMDTAAIGGTAKGGVCRLTLTDFDGQVRRWLIERCQAAGCAVTVDRMGNIFARRPGRDPGRKPVGFGSHLDTQPTGGKFDGILGVLAGLELMRTLEDAGYQTAAPLELVNWTNEEGARFAPGMLGSGVFSGRFGLDYALSRRDRDGKSFGAELERIGFAGEAPCERRDFAAFLELHIEQGPILEAEATDIGVVTGVQGMRWYEVSVRGAEAHAGTTPMAMRRDAFQGVVRLALTLEGLARAHGPAAVATIGVVNVRPGSPNVVPGEASFTIDLRHPEDSVLDAIEAAFRRQSAELAKQAGLEVSIEVSWASPPVVFDPRCIEAVRSAAEACGLSHREMVSGAGHDSVHTAEVAPTAMIFVPCEKGISHNEAERITKEQAAAGAQVLLQAVLALADA